MTNTCYHNHTRMGSVRRDSVGESFSCSVPDMLYCCMFLCRQLNNKDKPLSASVHISFCHIFYVNTAHTVRIAVFFCFKTEVHHSFTALVNKTKSLFYSISFDSSLAKH